MNDYDKLIQNISPLLKQTTQLHKQAEALGMFTNDRELLSCEPCGLMEDVTFEGKLITCYDETLGHDTGLRFSKTSEGFFHCPVCGRSLHESRSSIDHPTPSTERYRETSP